MKKLIGFVFQTVVSITLIAQVTIQPNVPTVGMIQKNQLWNLTVINGSGEQLDCRLDLILRDRLTGQEVLTAFSSQFILNNGAKQLNANTLSPLQYNNLTTGINNSIQGMIPAGNYSLCYILTATGKEMPIAEECLQFDTEPLSPPMLIFPADSAELDNAPNQFSWIPPTPAGMLDMLRYEVIIAAISPGQRPEESIQENVPFYADANLFTNMMNYPSSANSFEKDTWYAWQVVARDNKNYAGKSEVWVFRYKTNPILEIIKMAPYIKLSEKQGEVTTVHQGMLKMEYHNYLADSVAIISISDENEQSAIRSKIIELQIKPGQNYLQFDLEGKFNLNENTIYRVQLINSKGEKFLMKFKPKNYR